MLSYEKFFNTIKIFMKIITCNLNGIRSAAKKGFFNWLEHQQADVICLQEIKAQQEHIECEAFMPKPYHCYYHLAEKKGYSGVAIYTKEKPAHVQTGLGVEFIDNEGRYLRVDYENFSVISLYLPSGSSGEHRQEVKYQCMDVLTQHLKELKSMERSYIICGDWNIAHKNIDIKNWKGNQKNSGFLPEERAWLDYLFDQEGWVDAFRVVNSEADQYTWWSQRGQAYAKNVGWRIDYQIVSPGLKAKIQQVDIYKEEKFSDHAPLIVDYELTW